jgi:class 3 adenylate cyclase/predicted ATPase
MPKEEARAGEISRAKDWLEDIGLGRYADIFAQNRVDLDVLSDLTEADLAELGVPLGDRKRLLRAMASLVRATAESGSAATRRRSIGQPKSVATAERRQLTVMFCDMVGSTALSEQFDPEDLRDMIAAYRETCARAVKRYDGHVASYSGDGIMVYFGYPNAHEDDAERAVRTGLEIVRTISTQSKESPGLLGAPAVRIGVATGLVVVGDVTGESTEEHDSAVGEAPNLAARLQTLAPPNCVIIASSTQSLLRAKFEYEDLGSHALKGVSAPVQAWRVVRPRRVETRFAATVDSKLTPLVNREEEIALLLMRWQQAKECDGQVVLLSGEPGIGKSRIVQEFRERIASEPHGQMSFQCSPYYTSTAFYPFVDQLKSIIGFDREGSPELLLTSLEATLAVTTDRVELVTPLFAALLSIATGDRYRQLDLSPQRQKDDSVSALVNHFVGLARKQPAVMIFEDAHWIDPTSREVLDLLVDRVQDTSVLMVITCRPEFQPGWSAHSHITTLTLNRLSRQLRAVLIERVAGAKALAEEVVEEIIVKTDGVPLFMEELTKAVLESNLLSEKDGRYVFSRQLHQLAIPATLTDSLMARLDRMASFKEVAQIGATIGREFSYELLRAVAETPADQLNAALSHLEHAGLIIRRGHPPEAAYAFKHALVQDAAHSSLLHSDRKQLHAKIAAVLAEIYPERAEREPELLAHHFTEADQSEPAVDFWLKAGKRAAKTRANLEAIAHLRRGLEVLEGDPDIPDRNGIELALRIELGILLIAAKGYAVQEVEKNYVRAVELGQQLDDKQKIFAATRGLWVCYFIRADMVKAHDLGVQMLKMAERTHRNETADQARQRTGYLIEAHRALGMTMFWGGRFVASRDHLERGIGLYDPNLHGSLSETHGIDPGIVCLMYLGYLLWFLGCPDQARKCCEQALSSAERMRHPITLAFALAFTTYLCQHLRDVEGTRDHANRTMAICTEHGFVFYKQQATMLRGWALAELGHIDDGLNHIRAGLDAYEAMESGLACPWFRSLLANAYVRAGRADAALRALDDAVAIAERTGERSHLAEIYRLQGEITYTHRGPEAAGETEACYKRSLEVCRKQEAVSWELRTAVSLARLWRDAGKRQDAADLLAPICGRFKQGFDTLDLKEAVQMMSELEAL